MYARYSTSGQLAKRLVLMTVLVLPLGLKCSGVDNLPPLGDAPGRPTPDSDRFQAIVPDYRFQCSGRVTEWRACVQPGGRSSFQFYIIFQVWRPGHNGCYNLVGFNSPLNNDGTDGVLRAQIDGEGRCVRLSVAVDQQFDVQEGDVIGYYADYFRDGEDSDNGGIQWNTDSSSVIVYYTDNLPRDQIKPTYAIDGASAIDCGAPSSDSLSYSLSNSMSAAPIISLTFVQAPPTTNIIVPTETSGPQPPSMTTPLGDNTNMAPTNFPTTSHRISTTIPLSSKDSRDPHPSSSVNPSGNITDSNPSDSELADSKVIFATIAIIPSILILSIATILLLLRRKRKMSKLQLSEHVTYSFHDHKGPTEECVKFPQTTNPAYVTNIRTSTNEAYDPISLDTSENIAYTTNTDISHENERISTDENVAYGTTSNEEFTASENLAYGLRSNTIPISDNPSYGPVEGDTNADLKYDYVAER